MRDLAVAASSSHTAHSSSAPSPTSTIHSVRHLPASSSHDDALDLDFDLDLDPTPGLDMDVPTAVNTPGIMTPRETHRDLPDHLVAGVDGEPDKGLRLFKSRGEEMTEQEARLRRNVQIGGKPAHLREQSQSGSDDREWRIRGAGEGGDREKGMGAGGDGDGQREGNAGLEKKEILDLGNGPEEVIVIDWLPNDPANPFNWTNRRKYTILLTAVLTGSLTAINCTSVAILTAAGGPEHYGVSRQDFVLTVTLLIIAISNTPLLLAPLSEVLGRNIIYQVTSIITMFLFLPQALSTNFSAILAVRWFQGMSSSVGNSMVGGTVADLFRADDRGTAMNLFAFAIFAGQSFGGVFFGWIAMNLGIPWAYWIQFILAGISCLLNFCFLRETRADVLLSRRAKRLTKSTGRKHLCAADMQRQSLVVMMRVSVIRPLQYLCTEPIVTALSLWIGFAWACVFLGGTSVLLVFEQYGWNYGQLGSIQIVVFLGGLLGWLTSIHQEKLYQRAASKPGRKGKAPPEARLYYAAYGGLAFPLAMYAFAWTGRPEVHWVVPALFLVVANWGIYCMYSGIFNYLADAYETYSSSAQAAQSWARNMASSVFPLFAYQMYTRLGYPQASTLVASIALVLAAAPLLLLRYGKTLRARSRVASALEAAAEAEAEAEA